MSRVRKLSSDPLAAISRDDLLASFGLAAWRGTALAALFAPAARGFARKVRAFDDEVGAHGLSAGGAWLVRRMAGGLQVAGRSHLPVRGPLLVLANHPGMTDTVALFASLRMRPDLRVIAQDRPFLRALPNVAAHIDFVDGGERSRSQALRAGVRHLREGGALLTFPAGAIEPDLAAAGPARAAAALAGWSGSFALFARAVPETRIVPAVVSQVISRAATHSPLTRLRRAPADREQLAVTLQILWPRYRRLPARVAFGAAVQAGAFGDAAALREAVVAEARALMESPPTAWEEAGLD